MTETTTFPAATANFQAVPTETAANTPDASQLNLSDVLDLAIEKEASDIHFGAEARIAMRIFGEIRFVSAAGEITKADAERLIFGMLKGAEEIEKLKTERELDFSYLHVDGTTFRVNAFYRRGRISAVLRRIARSVPSLDELGLPQIVHELAHSKQGLILVTGPTGSGKSTTLCSILEEINETRVEHIVTIEDPIEYIFTDKKCVFSQREVHYDTNSFDSALRAAMRQDPDIVMVGEMRDRETITAALNLCETGHLVLSTLHTNSAPGTISRLAQAFNADQRGPVLARIADSLVAVISQQLLPKIGGGRVALHEIMIANGAMRNAVRQGDMPQLDNIIATSLESGMQSAKFAAQKLIAEGKVTAEAVEHVLNERD